MRQKQEYIELNFDKKLGQEIIWSEEPLPN